MYDDIVGGYPLVKGGIEAIPIRLETQLIHAFIPEDNIILMPLRKMHGRKEIVQRYPRADRHSSPAQVKEIRQGKGLK